MTKQLVWNKLCTAAADRHTINESRFFGSSASLDPKFFCMTAFCTCEREVLECSSEQNWCDTSNDHFCSALGTRRRSFFRWQFFASHVISFHARLPGAGLIGE